MKVRLHWPLWVCVGGGWRVGLVRAILGIGEMWEGVLVRVWEVVWGEVI